ncbi:hypothetical protein HDU97_002327 [Phlyctochytrium planicorne]|nr:hypothetical protein HDU97_002327 [Phlyctochytrium planicorne]
MAIRPSWGLPKAPKKRINLFILLILTIIFIIYRSLPSQSRVRTVLKFVNDAEVESGLLDISSIRDRVENVCKRAEDAAAVPLVDGDLRQIASNLKIYRELANHKRIESKRWLKRNNGCYEKYSRDIGNRLFYWLLPNKTLESVQSNFKGKGIVVSVGYWQLKHAVVNFRALREVLRCNLPIEVFYNGEDDLPHHAMQVLLSIPNLKVVNLATVMNTRVISGWATKPFAMLFSSFKEVILMDADSMFLRRPSELFDFKGYKQKGSLFFRDRTVLGQNVETIEWLRKIIGNVSDYAMEENRIFAAKSVHELESGVVVIDKGRNINFDALVLTALVNDDRHRRELWARFYGDKETWWIAHELIGSPYHLANGGGGSIGYPFSQNEKEYVCGGLLHVDERWRPIWFNGGLIANKHFSEGKMNVLKFTHWIIDRDYEHVEWLWEESNRPFCLLASKGSGDDGAKGMRNVHPMESKELDVVEFFYKAWKEADHIEF